MAQKKIVILADPLAEHEFLSRSFPEGCDIIRIKEISSFKEHNDAWLCFVLQEEIISSVNDLPFSSEALVFIAGVESTFRESEISIPYIRINAWPGFLKNPLLELSAPDALHLRIAEAMQFLHWDFRMVADIPGLVTPRVISMIINEACFAVQENVSSKNEIDTAMKLGTNYPRGPFEWSRIIGAERIISLLRKLSVTDPRYTPAPGMEKILTAE